MNNNNSQNSSITEVLCSIAKEEMSLAKMLNTEGEKLQKGICLAERVEELIDINCSVSNTIIDVTNLEIVLYNKLKAAMGCGVLENEKPCKNTRCVCIQGIVCDSCGNRIAGAQVVAIGNNKKMTYTNRYGHYRIDMLEIEDKFTIFAECDCSSSDVFECCDSTYYYYHHDIQIDCEK